MTVGSNTIKQQNHNSQIRHATAALSAHHVVQTGGGGAQALESRATENREEKGVHMHAKQKKQDRWRPANGAHTLTKD